MKTVASKYRWFFYYQDMWDLVKNGMTPISGCATNNQKNSHKELKKKD